MRTRALLLAAILVVCVVGRGAYVLYLVHSNGIETSRGDAPTYLGPARELADHGRFDSVRPPGRPEFVRTPGYPAFIAAVYRVFGRRITAVLLAQVALSALTVFLTYLLAARIWSVPIGLLAALLTALEPSQSVTSAELLTECLATLLLIMVAAAGFAALADDTPRPRRWALLGLLVACAALVRPVTYYLPLLVVVLLFIRRAQRHERWPDLARMTAAFLVPLVILVGGWQLRNHERVGSWRFSGVEARNLYLYRAAGVVARDTGIPLDTASHRLGAQFGPIGAESQGSYYDRMFRAGLHILKSHPAAAIIDFGDGLRSELFSARLRFSSDLDLGQVSGAIDVAASVVLLAFYGACGYGMVLVVRRRRDLLAHAFVVGVAVYVLLASAGPEAVGGRGERFRSPIMPILILYAAGGAYALFDRVSRMSPRADE